MTLCKLTSGSALGAALSLAVTTMGAGILTLPSAYADAGVIPASLLLLFVAYITVYSVDFIILAVDKLGLNSYEEITRELLGRKMEEVVRWMLLVYNIGSAIGYLVVIGDLFEPMQPLITSYVPWLTTPKHTLVIFWFCIILPMSCIPRLGALHVTSFLAIFATCFISALIVFRFFAPGPSAAPLNFNDPALINKNVGSKSSNNDSGGFGNWHFISALKSENVLWWYGRHPLLALPIIMFSFDCQSLVFQIYANLDDMRRRTMFTVSSISLLVSCTIHAAVGLFGYLTNPTDVRDNVISNYDPNKDALFAVGYIIYAIPINLAFVLLLFPIRDSIFILWYGFSSASVATHVPRRRDFTRIVDAEDELDERLTVLESQTANTSFAGGGSLFAAAHASSQPFRSEGTGQQTGLASAGKSIHHYGSTASTNGVVGKVRSGLTSLKHSFAPATGSRPPTPPPAGAEDTTTTTNNTNNINNINEMDPETAQLYEKARSEQRQLRHRKKLHNDCEVIPFRDHLIVSVTLSTVCVAAALVMPGIVSVVALLGGLCSSTLCFTVPALYRWALDRNGLSVFKTRHKKSKPSISHPSNSSTSNRPHHHRSHSYQKGDGTDGHEGEGGESTSVGRFFMSGYWEWFLMVVMLLFGAIGGTLGTFVAMKVLFL